MWNVWYRDNKTHKRIIFRYINKLTFFGLKFDLMCQNNGFSYCWIPPHGPQERAEVCIGVILGWKEQCRWFEEGGFWSQGIHLEADDWCWDQVHPQQHFLILRSGAWYYRHAWRRSTQIWMEQRRNRVWYLFLHGQR